MLCPEWGSLGNVGAFGGLRSSPSLPSGRCPNEQGKLGLRTGGQKSGWLRFPSVEGKGNLFFCASVSPVYDQRPEVVLLPVLKCRWQRKGRSLDKEPVWECVCCVCVCGKDFRIFSD